MMRLPFGKKIIYGCESHGDAHTPYMTRYTLLSLPFVQVCLHVFHRSDAETMHDHPWPFASLILWRGYIEETASRFSATRDRNEFAGFRGMVTWEQRERITLKKRVWPGAILFRAATHAHRVILIGGRPAVTLVVMGKKQRNWGFFTKAGWQLWTDYFKERGC